MKKWNCNDILRQVATENGVTLQEVRAGIQETIDVCWNNPDPEDTCEVGGDESIRKEAYGGRSASLPVSPSSHRSSDDKGTPTKPAGIITPVTQNAYTPVIPWSWNNGGITFLLTWV